MSGVRFVVGGKPSNCYVGECFLACYPRRPSSDTVADVISRASASGTAGEVLADSCDHDAWSVEAVDFTLGASDLSFEWVAAGDSTAGVWSASARVLPAANNAQKGA